MRPKILVYACCFFVELLLFMYVYIGGSRGFLAIRALEQECSGLATACAHVSRDVIQLEREMNDWDEYPFMREARIRQDIQMTNPESTWYWYKESK